MLEFEYFCIKGISIIAMYQLLTNWSDLMVSQVHEVSPLA